MTTQERITMLRLRIFKDRAVPGDVAILAQLVRETECRWDEALIWFPPPVKDVGNVFFKPQSHKTRSYYHPRNRKEVTQ